MNEAANFDAEKLRARYRQEREKRPREEETRQYIELTGQYAGYACDPYSQEEVTRAPLIESVDALIIGAGYGGELMAANLIKNGIANFRIVDRAGDFGGTWYWNRYPGAACDTESYIYMPLLEDVGQMPSMKYAKGPELLEHARAIGRSFGLYDKALFQTEVQTLDWDERAQVWNVTTNRGDRIAARFVISVIGSLSKPKLPGIPGIESFKGHSFHTSRWDYDYTGGSSLGGLEKLKDKRVGIIGTGATAIQCVPHLGEWAKQLFVFQRTPSVVDVRNDQPTDPDWAASLKPGWQDKRMANFNTIVSGGQADADLVNDGWTDLLGTFRIVSAADKELDATERAKALERADFEKMERVRSRVDSTVRDKATAEALKPYFSLFCKRPCFHDEYLQTFNRENVTLVDTKGKGVERITPEGVVVDGTEYPLDLLVFSTGFEVNSPYTRRGGFVIKGRGGLSLDEAWADGPETLHGFMTRGFPNFLIISQMQGGAAANFTHMLGEQARHVAYIIVECGKRGIDAVEPTVAAQAAWVDEATSLAATRVTFNEQCTPGYYNNEGHVTQASLKRSTYFATLLFLKIMRTWREDGDMPGLEMISSTPS